MVPWNCEVESRWSMPRRHKIAILDILSGNAAMNTKRRD